MKHHTEIRSFLCALTISLLAGASLAQAADTIKSDNTGMNKLDGSRGAVTADQQGSSKSDREITRLIRKSVVSDKALSSYGHNIKIITRDGVVTLKGPVKSEREKMDILNRANTVTGGASVTDEMSVTR